MWCVLQKPVVQHVAQHVVQKSQSTPHIDLTKDDGEDFTKDVELDWTKGYFQKSGEQLNSSIMQAPSSISNKKDYHCKVNVQRELIVVKVYIVRNCETCLDFFMVTEEK